MRHAFDRLEIVHGLFECLAIRFLQGHAVDDIVVVDDLDFIFLNGFQQRFLANLRIVHHQEHIRRVLRYVLVNYGSEYIYLLLSPTGT